MYKHCRKQYNRWTFRFCILGKYVDAGESYDDEQLAGCAADLAKTYLRNEFSVDLEASLSGEQFSALAYSRRGVDLTSSYSLEKSLAPGVRKFIKDNLTALQEIKNASPPETVFSKFRRDSSFTRQPEIHDWVLAGEAAELRQRAFSAINHVYFFSLLDALSSRLSDALGPIRRAAKMHEKVSDALLVARANRLSALVTHLEQNLQYVTELAADLRTEQASVESAVAALEASRPALV